jgi:hypothetical protein
LSIYSMNGARKGTQLTVQLTKRIAAHEGRSWKKVRWNKGFAKIHEGGMKEGYMGRGPLYTVLPFLVGQLRSP